MVDGRWSAVMAQSFVMEGREDRDGYETETGDGGRETEDASGEKDGDIR